MTRLSLFKYLVLCVFLIGSSHSFAGDVMRSSLLKIQEAVVTYQSVWPSGMCRPDADFTPGVNDAPDSLKITFNSDKGPVSFTIYGVRSDDYDNTKPGLNPDQKWIENGNNRINFKYVSFMSSVGNLNVFPLANGPYMLWFYVGIYPDIKKNLQVTFEILDTKTNNNIFHADLANAENCKALLH